MNLVDTQQINNDLEFLGNLAPAISYANVDIRPDLNELEQSRNQYYQKYQEYKRIFKVLQALYVLHIGNDFFTSRKYTVKELITRLRQYTKPLESSEYCAKLFDKPSGRFKVSQAYINTLALDHIAECVYKFYEPLETVLYDARRLARQKMNDAFDKYQMYEYLCTKYKDYEPSPKIPFKPV